MRQKVFMVQQFNAQQIQDGKKQVAMAQQHVEKLQNSKDDELGDKDLMRKYFMKSDIYQKFVEEEK